MKNIIFLLLFVFSFQSYSQDYIPSKNFKFKFIKAKKAVGGTYYTTVKIPRKVRKSQGIRKVQVRIKIKSLSKKKEDFDPNKFYLVSDEYKIRVRPLDIRHNYAVGWIYLAFPNLVNKTQKDTSLDYWVKYKPNIKDTFYDFKIEGLNDINPAINFGTKQNPKIVNPYFDHKKLKSCKIDLYFSLPKELENIKIYYGDILIKETKIR